MIFHRFYFRIKFVSKVILLFDFLPCVVFGVILVKAVLVEVEISMVDFVVAGEEDDVGNEAFI